ncbi:MAG: acyl-CoA thioesterase [Bdellovibrionaceae bacterium]|nr:acyl-CoA thioesterase [Pseudobdellovibrionaceae bacterium]
MFHYEHRVQFYETDLMGIVHHSNYLRFFEEARVAWAHAKGLIDYQRPESAAHFAVLSTQVKHLRPALFGDLLKVQVQARREGIRVIFEYRILRDDVVLAVGESRHAPLGKDLKPIRLPEAMKTALEKESWTETWLSNS